MPMYRRMKSLVAAVVLVGLWGAPGYARPGELPKRIPEAAPYHVTEAEAYEPAVGDGATPVPMAVTNGVLPLARTAEATPPTATPYPRAGADNVYEDVVVKVVFSAPVTGVDATTVTLTDAQGMAVPASVAQTGADTWGLFPHQVFLTRGETYTARVAAAVCDFAQNCLAQALTWRFTITVTPGGGQGDTSIPLGGSRPAAGESQAIMRSPAPVEPPGEGPPPPPKPDAALSTPTQTARP